MRIFSLLYLLLLRPIQAAVHEPNGHEYTSMQQINDNASPYNQHRKRHRQLPIKGERRGRRRQLEQDSDEGARVWPHEHRVGKKARKKDKKSHSGDSRKKTPKIHKSKADDTSSREEAFLDNGQENSAPDEALFLADNGHENSAVDVVEVESGIDTSQCKNAIEVQVGETVQADATHPIDHSKIEDCEGGFDLQNPFVEVLGIWFAVEGTGGTTLTANSCPALVSVYQGENCDDLACAPSSSYHALGCQVEWQSAPVGQVDYILVQDIELNEGGDGFELPLRLTIKEVTPETSPEGVEEEAPVSAVDDDKLDSDDTDSSLMAPLRLQDKDLQRCQRAKEASIGESTDVSLKNGSPIIGYCDGPGGLKDMDDVGVKVTSAWFTVEGTGQKVKATTCPGRVTIFAGESCDTGTLECAELSYDQYGCQIDWEAAEGTTYFVLVQNIEYDENQDEDSGFKVPITLTLEPLGNQDDYTPSEPSGPSTSMMDDEGQEDTDSPYTALEIVPSHLDSCQSAELVVPGNEVLANAAQLGGSAAECDHKVTLHGFDVPILGAWFSVAGTGDILKASACPARITVFTGTCDSLTCAESDVNEFGCEAKWKSSENGQLDYILVQTFGFEEGDGGFVLPVTLLVEDPNGSLNDGSQLQILRDPPGQASDGARDEDHCESAELVAPGNGALANAGQLGRATAACDHRFTLDGFDVPLLGAWYSVAGTGDIMKASACPARITVFTGTCDSLTCAESYTNNFDCEVEWKSSEKGQLDHILVQTFGFEGEGEGFVLPVTLFIEDPNGSHGSPSQSLSDGAGAEAPQNEALVVQDVNSCAKAEHIDINESIPVPLDLPIANTLECNNALSDHNGDTFGSWFTIEGKGGGKRLRASAGPDATISVYEGECGDLECVNTEPAGKSGNNEVEWRPTRRGTQQHILVQTMRGTSNTEPLILLLEEA